MPTPYHGASEGRNEYEYVSVFEYEFPNQSRRVSIGQSDFVQRLGLKQVKVATIRDVKGTRIQALIEQVFPEADGWQVPPVEPARAVGEQEQVDLWHFELIGTRFAAS